MTRMTQGGLVVRTPDGRAWPLTLSVAEYRQLTGTKKRHKLSGTTWKRVAARPCLGKRGAGSTGRSPRSACWTT